MPQITEVTFGGRQVKLASPSFSEETCELIELFDQARKFDLAQSCRPKNERTPFGETSRLIVLLWRVAKDCIVRGGHTEQEAKEILASISLDEDQNDGIPALAAAIGVS